MEVQYIVNYFTLFNSFEFVDFDCDGFAVFFVLHDAALQGFEVQCFNPLSSHLSELEEVLFVKELQSSVQFLLPRLCGVFAKVTISLPFVLSLQRSVEVLVDRVLNIFAYFVFHIGHHSLF